MSDETPRDRGEKAAPMAAFVAMAGALLRIFGHEIELARYDAEKAKRDAIVAVVALVLGLVLVLIGLNVLAGAAVAALAKAGLGPAWAAVVVGFGAILLAVIGILLGVSRLKAAQDMPKRRIASLKNSLLGFSGRGR